jgi:glycosyltransferase involved in cell wall biosynthesis
MKTPTSQGQKPLKFFILSAKGWGTGSALRAYYIAQALQKRGHQVTFVKPIPTLPFWLDMVLSKPYYLFISLFVRSNVALAVKPYPMVIPALWIQRLKGAKVVIDIDDLDYAYSRGWFKKLHQWLQKPWPNWADLVTYHNLKLRGPILDFFGVPPAKLIQLAQGVDLAVFNPSSHSASNLPPVAAALFQNKNARPILAFTAHLNIACDLEPVLQAFQKILKSIPQAQLLVAGGGPDANRFKRIARDLGMAYSVHFTGLLSPTQVAASLKISDVSLVYYSATPANEHRASMKLREALACGCRVVATDVGEAALFKKAAFLSPPGPAHYAQTVLKALKTKKKPQAGALLVKKWDWTDCVAVLEKEFQNR